MAELKSVKRKIPVQEEMTGIEWEAEKAYIIATSPRSNVSTNSIRQQQDDDFSWDDTATNSDTEKQNTSHDSVTHDTSDISIVDSLTIKPDIPTVTPLHSSAISAAVEISANQDTSSITTTVTKESVSPPTSTNTLHDNSNILVIYGPSGLGRNTLVKKLVYNSPQLFSLVISHTTRQPKPDEMYARDYYFVSHSDMINKIKHGKFMEYVQIDSNPIINTYSNSPLTLRQSYSSFSAPLSHDNNMATRSIKATSSEGYLYGTTWDAFQESQSTGKPWIVLNVSTKGAEQLKDIGIQGHYLLMNSTSSHESDRLIPDYIITYDKSENEAFSYLENYILSLTDQHCTTTASHKPTTKLETAHEEWERVPSVQLPWKQGAKTKRGATGTQKLSQKRITFIELLSHFQSSDLSQQLAKIKPEISHSTFSKVFKPRRTINKKLHDERNLVFAIALCKYDDHNTLHARTLSTIYQYLSGSTATCARFGIHWEDIGFQGSDPIDDLRGVGMLGLLQLVWFLDTPLMNPIAIDIYNYSKRGPTPLPYCVISINITCIVLQSLREGYISKECNRSDQVFIVCNNLYAAIFVSFYHNWKRHTKGVMELGNVLQRVGNFAKRNARFMIRELDNYIQDRQKKSSLKSPDILIEPSVEFSNIAEM